MLKLRILTGLILATAGLIALFGLPPLAFAVITGGVFLGLGGREVARLARLTPGWPRAIYALAVIMLGTAGYCFVMPEPPAELWLVLGAIWLWPLFWLIRFRNVAGATGHHPPSRLILGAGILVAAWLALAWLQTIQPWWVFLLLVVISAADVGAYFCGRAIGGPRLAPAISPGKTWAGVAGAVVFAPMLTALAAWLIPASPFPPLLAACVATALVPISIMGDLFVSMLKRLVGLKDSGTLLPGHGGMLDRFDSIVAALPFYAMAVTWTV